MRARLFATLALFALLLAPAAARAQCPQWMVGAFWLDFLTNGANAGVGASTIWDPDGSGPLQPELVVAGAFTAVQGTPTTQIAALSAETGQWQPLGSGISGQAMCMAVYNGDLYVAGTISNAGGTPVNYIARWDGSSWHDVGGGVTIATYIRCMTVWNNELVVGGLFLKAGGNSASNIAAWDGTSWHALGSGTSGTVVCLTNSSGTLIAGGAFTTAGGVTVNNVASWNGSAWSSMNGGLFASFAALQPYNGLIYAACNTTVSGSPAAFMAAWNGSSWSTSATFANTTFNAMTAVTGSLWVGGSATTGGGGPANGVFLYNGSLVPLGTSTGITGTTLCLIPYHNELIDGGSFTAADGRLANNIARWDGTNWGTFGGGNSVVVDAFGTFGSSIVAGGNFHQFIKTQPEAHNVVAFLNGSMTPFGTGMDGAVTALKTYTTGIGVNHTTTLMAGGAFAHAGGNVVNNVARWSQQSIIFNPVNWAAMGSGFDGQVFALERFSNVNYAGGFFSFSGATGVSYIAKFNETSGQWEPVGTGMNGTVHALKVFGSFLYAGGEFTTAGGVSTGGLARWDGTSWSSVGGFFNGTVYALEVYNGALVMAGSFAGFGGSPNLSSFNGTSYANLGSGGTNSTVRSLHADGTRLYVGGDFTSLGGVGVNRLGYWDGSAWHDADGGADNTVLALQHFHNHVQVGGDFATVNFGGFVGSPTWAQFDETGIPQFFTNPFSQTGDRGSNITFTAVPDTGYTGTTLQWLKDGVPLSDGPTGFGSTITGAHTENLNITNMQGEDLGNYRATVHDGCGTDSSSIATLSGNLPVAPGTATGTTFDALGPNPTAGTTQVFFSLARAARVSLAVRDVAGRLLREVDLGAQPAGRHQVAWDAGEAGSRIRAGVYLLELRADGRPCGARRLTIVR